jgi:hypothetical protein
MPDALAPGPRHSAAVAPLVALRERREQVIAILTEQFSRDTLDLEELEKRLDLAHRADSVVALDNLVKDLTAAEGTGETALAPRTETAVDEATLARWPARKRMTAIFGGLEKKGAWVCPREVAVVAIFGGADIDLREAELAPGVTELSVTTIFGGVEVIVPPWLSVEVDATAILGGFEEIHRAPTTPDPDRRILRITGTAVLGGVEIHTRLPGESARDAKRRRRREAKALKGEGRSPAALPEARARKRD